MTAFLLVIHLFLAIAMVVSVLLQRSEGGALGIGGGGAMGGLMTGRGTANLLTRATAVLAACFMLTSLVLAILAGAERKPISIMDQAPAPGAVAPVEPVQPVQPKAPTAPVAN